ncbi:MAG: aminopeptidase N [Xanthomonadaceae bacterium]|nr:aminopeptidase N [Xanthomonadaceae bacterium]
MTQPRIIHRQDYTPPAYLIDDVRLEFELGEQETLVHSELTLRRNGTHDRPLVLDGQDLQLLSVAVDGVPLPEERYQLGPESLTIPGLPERCTLQISTRIFPQLNTKLEGLYKSNGIFCTQCEAEGFRRITYYLDRPDVMARFRTRLVADRERYPVLLSNGNPVARGTLGDGRHFVEWEDPFPKPSYLFAMVAGDLACNRDYFVTASGRRVTLEIYVAPHELPKTEHAMECLKRAMRWDEETYGQEYDLDIYMIVAVGDFNMGAMENKGLNIFNTQYILADRDTATDVDFDNVLAVIGHEYFHNWTGNRVTCRDWFQLSLKEGLTVFREQQFASAMGSAAVQRIGDVRVLRAQQFPEDAGPMAHPVRPDSYVEINNFYTATVYNKGAEVIRMYHTLLGEESFRRGLALYLRRHDGQAATCDDFLAAMAEANQRDLSQFARWYSQAGTPQLEVSDHYDPATGRYTLRVRQSCPPTPGQPEKLPFHIPLKLGLLDSSGRELPLQLEHEAEPVGIERVLELTEAQHEFHFVGLKERPLPSLLRDFSAPVRLDYPYSDQQLAFLFTHDTDPFNRWEAGQRLMTSLLLSSLDSDETAVPTALRGAFEAALTDPDLDPAFVAEALTLPSEGYVGEHMEAIDPGKVHEARERLRRSLGEELRELWLETYRKHGNLAATANAAGQRRLKNLALDYLLAREDEEAIELAARQYLQADNLTDRLAALSLLADHDLPAAAEALESFYQRWQHEPLVVDKWFRVQALSRRPDTLQRVRALTEHPAFELRNPNKVRALVGAFCHHNLAQFHHPSGAGYTFLTEYVLKLDKINPQIAARLATALIRWRRFEPQRAQLMRECLRQISVAPSLSADVYEVVTRSLEDA